MKKFVRESWLIVLLGGMFAVLLAAAQTSLSPRIQANAQAALNQAIAAVVPNVASTQTVDVPGYQRAVYRCLDAEGQLAGYAVDAVGNGFADKIRLVAGLSADLTQITGIKVIENIETPGLGNKISEQQWAGQFQGLDATRPTAVTKKQPVAGQNEIQAITGATISSQAVTSIVNEAFEQVRPELAKLR